VRKVLIATPAHDGRLDVWYTTSLVNSVRVAQAEGVFLHPVFMSYDALVQRARNDQFRLAVEGEYDDMIFIDGDLEWNPMWIMELLKREEDVVGGTYRKKTDDAEMYVMKTQNLQPNENGLIKVDGLGTGFVKLSRKAFMALWESSEPYQNEGREGRMVCDIKIVDGQLCSEDVVLFQKLKALGFDVWLDLRMTCVHIGTKKFYGNFEDFVKRLAQQAA
jgi:glycosyltransferase involved in cell wall biosynthesis